MDVLFIIISIMLNMLLFFAVVILYLRQNKIFGAEEAQKRTIKEMEELISAYILEMKEDNEQFIKRMKELINETTFSERSLLKNEQTLPFELEKNQETPFSNRLEKTVSLHAVKAYEKQKIDLSTNDIISPSPLINSSTSVEKQEKIIQKEKSAELETPYEEESNPLANQILINQLKIWKKEGLTEEEMAKRLNKGKTEIALLLKFQEKYQ